MPIGGGPENLVDQLSKAHVRIDLELYLVHAGRGFTHSETQSVASAASIDHLIVTPSNQSPHLRVIELSASGSPFNGYLYENATVSANGTVTSWTNFNRTSNNVAQSALYEGPTVTGTGNVLFAFATTGTKQDGGITDQTNTDWVLKPSTNYLIRFTNNSGQTQNATSRITIFENVGVY